MILAVALYFLITSLIASVFICFMLYRATSKAERDFDILYEAYTHLQGEYGKLKEEMVHTVVVKEIDHWESRLKPHH